MRRQGSSEPLCSVVGRLPGCAWVWTQPWDLLLAPPPFPPMAAEAQRTPLSLCVSPNGASI